MTRKRSTKSRSLTTLLVLLVLIVFGLSMGKNHIVKSAIEKTATAALHVPVAIDDLNLSLLSGQLAVKGVRVGNPSGFENPQALVLNEGEVKLKLASLMEPVLVIETIRLNGLAANFEINEKGNNISALVKGLQQPASKTESKNSTEATRQLIIRDLAISNATVNPSVRIGGQNMGQAIALADIHLRDLGREGKTISTADAGKIVLASLSKNIGKSLPQNLLQQGVGNIEKGLKDIGAGILDGFTN